jgi:predicted amidohydrolase YtcJ
MGWVDAIAIRDGRVAAAGGRSDVASLAGHGTRRRVLPPGLVALPGITDAHLHLASAASAAQQLDLGGAGDRGAVLDAIASAHADRAASGDRDGWLLGHGWSLDRMGAWPSADHLQRVAPGRPIALWTHDHHARWVSTAALAAAGIGASTPDPPGGRVGRDGDGSPDGMLFEDAATLVDRVIPEATTDALAAALADHVAVLLALGVTGAHDPGEMVPDRR